MRISVQFGPDRMADFRNPAIVVAHPGHELKVFGWLSESMPRAHILTDGSGAGASRLHASGKLLQRVGAVSGELFGALSDAEIYLAIVDRRVPLFLRMVDQLADSFIRNATDFVAGDATEGFNPTHDICRALVNAAVAIAKRSTGRRIANYEFCLTEWELHRHEIHDERCLHLRLEDSLLNQKLRAAADYAPLKIEIEQALASQGEEYFRIECLRRVIEPLAAPPSKLASKPDYETWGEERVGRGKYVSVIRYEQHMLPILTALRDYAFKSAPYSDFGKSPTVAERR